MFDYFRGTVGSAEYPCVVLDVHGVGYRFRVPQSCHQNLPLQGEEATLFASLYVREDQMTLYGFSTPEKRCLFERLIAISGVGPNIGLQILSTFSPNELQEAILKEDFARIARVKGIGPKLARRIVLEVKGLVSELFGSGPDLRSLSPGISAPTEEAALAALQKLGYPRKSAARALEEVRAADEAPVETEELVRAALRIL